MARRASGVAREGEATGEQANVTSPNAAAASGAVGQLAVVKQAGQTRDTSAPRVDRPLARLRHVWEEARRDCADTQEEQVSLQQGRVAHWLPIICLSHHAHEKNTVIKLAQRGDMGDMCAVSSCRESLGNAAIILMFQSSLSINLSVNRL